MTRKKVILAILLMSYLLATCFSYASYVQGDFSIYFQAGLRIRNGMDLYTLENNLYVYGPLLANLLSSLSNLSELAVSRIWLLSNIISTISASWILYKTFLTKYGFNGFLTLSGIIVLSFAFRNNLGNGNVMALVLLCVVVAIRLGPSSYSVTSSAILSLLTIFVFEVKAYLALFLIFFLFICRRFLALILCLLFALLLNLFYLANSGSSYFNWIEALKVRSTGLQGGSDQATILVFANRLLPGPQMLGEFIAIALYFIIFVIVVKRSRLLEIDNPHLGLVLFSAAPILTIFSHGQDFLLSTLALAFFLLKLEENLRLQFTQSFSLVVSLGFLVNWTNENWIPGLLSTLLLALILVDKFNAKGILILSAIAISLVSTALNAHLLSLGGDIQYQTYNFQALLFGIACFFVVINSIRSKGLVKKPD